jgi:hypothetical protein
MKLVKGLSDFKNKLTRFNSAQPLGKLSLVIVILLDIFLLWVVFAGLDKHTNQLTSINEYFPFQCRQALIEERWSNANKLDRLQDIVLTDYNNYLHTESFFDKDRLNKMHPACKQYFQAVKAIAEDQNAIKLFIERQRLQRKLSDWRTQHNLNKGVYDTQLLENIADKDSAPARSLALAMKGVSAQYEKLYNELLETNSKILKTPVVEEFLKKFDPQGTANREKLISDIKQYEIVYAFKEISWQLLFLLPIFAGALIWHVKSTNKRYPTQTLFSAHLLTIASIPIVIKIIELVLDLIPNKFFRTLFKILERLHIIALWHYLLIILALATAILFVYVIQKKFFNKKRVFEKRLIAGKCWSCGKKLPHQIKHCPFCGQSQTKKCPHCGCETFYGGTHCANCGKEN